MQNQREVCGIQGKRFRTGNKDLARIIQTKVLSNCVSGEKERKWVTRLHGADGGEAVLGLPSAESCCGEVRTTRSFCV